MGQLSPLEREILTYSYYRDAELRGSNLLYRLHRVVDLLSDHRYLYCRSLSIHSDSERL